MAGKYTGTNDRMTWGQIWTLTVSCAAVALVVAAMAALNTALADLARDTGATQAQLTWIVDGYTLALACLLLPSGALGDRYGRRGLLVIGLLLFGLASASPILLDSPTQIIGARAVAGLGAAFVMPATLSILTASFPAEQRSKAVGIWSGVAGSGGIAGLIGSGLLLEKWSWHAIFIGLAGVSAVLFALAFTIPSSRDEHPSTFDIRGAVLSAGAIGLFVLGIIEAPGRGWLDPWVLAAIVGGLAAGALFAVVEARTEHPLLDVRLFGNRTFGVGAVSLLMQFLATFGLFFLIVQHLQLVLGYSPLQSALALAPIAVVVIGLSVAAPWLIPRIGLRILTILGLAVLGVALALIGQLDAGSTYREVAVPLLIAAVGLGLCTAPATTAIVQNTPVAKQGVASAVNDATREIGAAIGVALAGSVLAAGYGRNIAPAVDAVPEQAKQPVGDSLAAALEVSKLAGPQGEQLADFAKESFLHGMQEASLALAGVMFVSAVALGLWAPGGRGIASIDEAPAHEALADVD
ncbi:MFS transporter [Prescottella equi]|uniref:MFS transporter n=1 Tax=Rhodococcus hoagii TaxID=43767 RepID=UPI0007CD7864|nr:MFS transporter [Prescottella equi]ORL03311.1 MFS transporter [Prescottella equi]UNQ34684.1 MFS transporter [Prescottella equi]